MYSISDIKVVHLEITQNCQASCPMCDRNINGGSVNPHINLDELSFSDIKQIFPINFIKQLDRMYMCGNLGDPIIARDTLDVFRYFRQYNDRIWLSMNTNAGAREAEWWIDLARIFGRNGSVTFSVDGIKSNHIYRQGVVWENVERSMRSFIGAGGRARWDYLIFEHNQHELEDAREFSKQLGFEKFIEKKSGRFVTTDTLPKQNHQAKDRKGNDTIDLKKPDQKFQNNALKTQNTLIEKYGSMDRYYDVVHIDCKVKKENSIFITAEGLALPCCWTAGRMYKWWHKDPKVEQIWNFLDAVGGKDAINVKTNGLQKVFNSGIFELIQSSWNKPSCSSGKLKVCSMKCGVEFDPFAEQFK